LHGSAVDGGGVNVATAPDDGETTQTTTTTTRCEFKLCAHGTRPPNCSRRLHIALLMALALRTTRPNTAAE